MGSFGSLQGKKCLKTIFFRIFFIEKGKARQTPRPEFIVLYNGREPCLDYMELKLSDAFKDIEGLKLAGASKVPLELTVHVYNINDGHNPEILQRSKTLYGYSVFVGKIREQQGKGIPLEEAVKHAVKYCIENDILKGFLHDNGSGRSNMHGVAV